MQKNEVVQLNVPDIAKSILPHLVRSVLEAGAHPKIDFLPTEITKTFLEYATEEQIQFFPSALKRAEVDLVDHQIVIIADANPRELASIDPKKIFRLMDAKKQYRDWLNIKEQQGNLSWTLALFGTEAMAKEAGLTINEYWGQIIEACYLDAKDPVGEWRRIQNEQERVKTSLNSMEIDRVHVKGEDVDLWVKIGKKRKWLGGSGRNIPSFEIFVSPDWRGTQGWIRFNQPLYRYGNILKEVRLAFKDGLVTEADALQGADVLRSMIARENANKIGEFSLTDKRLSRITKFMATTLFDENVGGPFGNTHIALGRAYRDSFTGDIAATNAEEFLALGFNESPEHTDIISTTDRTVTAYLNDGSTKVIFEKGMFTV